MRRRDYSSLRQRSLATCLGWALLAAIGGARPAQCADDGLVVLASPETLPTVVVDVDLHEPLDLALADLRRCLATMSGREIAAVTADAKAATGALTVVTRKASEDPQITVAEIAKLGREEFIFRTGSKGVTIAARTPEGAQHGIYEILHRLGCRWFFPGQAWEDIPRSVTVALPVTDATIRPSFASRQIWYGYGAKPAPAGQNHREWARRNRQGGWLVGSVGHAYARIAHPGRDFDEHPEWFPVKDGRRHAGGQLCLSNKELQARAIAYAQAAFRKSTKTVMVSMSPNDGRGYCQCKPCAAMGSTSDQTLIFANVVARAINEEFPDRYLAMYAYSDNCAPPTINGHSNVIIYVATHFMKSKHSLEELLAGWSDHVSHLGIRDYYDVIIWSRDMTRWTVPTMRKRIPYYKKCNVIAITAEASCNWAPQGVNYYVASRLMWDHTTDVDKVLAEFYASWGPAAKPMQRYFEHCAKKGRKSLLSRWIFDDLQEAAMLAGDDPIIQKRVDLFRLYVHWVLLYRWHRKAKGADNIQRTAREAHHFAWRLGAASMVHSYGQFRERRMWRLPSGFSLREINRWKLSDEPLPVAPPLTGGIDDVLVDPDDSLPLEEQDTAAPGPKPFFTHNEVDALLAADIAALQAARQK